MKLKHSCTTKLFYNKYIYKLRLKNNVGTIFRGLNLRYAKSKLDEMQQAAESDLPILSPFRYGLREPRTINLETFVDACVIYSFLTKHKKECMIRCEGYTLDVYSNERDWLLDLSKQVNATEFWEPEEEFRDFLISNVNCIVTENPVEYPYKVYFNNYADRNFADYCENNSNIKIGKIALEGVKREQYLRGFYFWVKTEKQLMLAKIALGTGISKVIKYISKDDLHK